MEENQIDEDGNHETVNNSFDEVERYEDLAKEVGLNLP